VNAWAALAFLANTGAILLAVGTFLACLQSNLHRRSAILRAFAPVVAFYGAYFALFGYIAPWALSEYYDGPVGSGQATHGRSRLEAISPNIDSFLANLQGLNAYFLPFVSWSLVVLGVAYLIGRCPRILVFMTPFAFAWSFLLIGDTDQYFLLVAVTLIPFSIAAVVALVPRVAAGTLLAVATVALFAWTIALFLLPYRETEYPTIFEHVYARAGRPPNVVEPYDEVRRDVDRLLQARQQYLARDEGSLPQFYLKADLTSEVDARFAGFLGSGRYPIRFDADRACYRLAFAARAEVRLAITKLALCRDDAVAAARYDGSRLLVYLLRAPIPARF
jgi:hypothetical protein